MTRQPTHRCGVCGADWYGDVVPLGTGACCTGGTFVPVPIGAGGPNADGSVAGGRHHPAVLGDSVAKACRDHAAGDCDNAVCDGTRRIDNCALCGATLWVEANYAEEVACLECETEVRLAAAAAEHSKPKTPTRTDAAAVGPNPSDSVDRGAYESLRANHRQLVEEHRRNVTRLTDERDAALAALDRAAVPSVRIREERDIIAAAADRLSRLGLSMERTPIGDAELHDLAGYARRLATRLDMRAEDEQRKERGR